MGSPESMHGADYVPLPPSPSIGEAYRYTPLPNDTSIRLLEIQGVDADGVLRCSLVTSDLKDIPSYHCLSYCWGNPHAGGTFFNEFFLQAEPKYAPDHLWRINCDGGSLYVRTNVYEALCQFPRDAWSRHVRRRDSEQMTLLHRASRSGDDALVEHCLSTGIDVDMIDGHGKTPLQYAVESGHVETAERLIDAGAKIDKLGRTGVENAADGVQDRVAAYIETARGERRDDGKNGEVRSATRETSPDRYIWVDAICIDQENLAERSSQVAMMDQIFRNAVFTLVWLGAEDEYTELASKTISELASASGQIRNSEINPYRGQSEEVYKAAGVPFVHIEAWGALAALFCRQWYQRAWVCQEVIVSDHLLLFCGKHELLWDEMTKVAKDVNEQATTIGGQASAYFIPLDQPSMNVEDRLLFLAKWRQRRLDEAEDPSPDRLPFQDLVQETSTFLSTDPRDKIYALLGLQSVFGDSRFNLVADYSTSVERCYAEATKLIIEESRSLRILHIIHDPSVRRVSTLPSWAPDYSVTFLNMMTAVYKAGGEMSPFLVKPTEWDRLPVPAAEFDRIIQVVRQQPKVPGQDPKRTLNPSWFELAAALESPYVTGQSRTEVLWRTLCADLDSTGATYPSPDEYGNTFRDFVCAMICEGIKKELEADDYREMGAGDLLLSSLDFAESKWKEFCELCSAEDIRLDIACPVGMFQKPQHQKLRHTLFKLHCLAQCEEGTLCTPTLEEVKTFALNLSEHPVNVESGFMQSYSDRHSRRRLFVTEQGYLGLGPASLSVGDSVWIVPGLGGPLVFHEAAQDRVGDSTRRGFQLIGEAYVHGIMLGEAVTEGKLKFETVELS